MRIITLIFIIIISTPAHAVDLNVSNGWMRALSASYLARPTKELSDAEKLRTLKKVHLRYAATDYITDMKNYGVEDFWASRQEMKKRGGGDCEDIAIAKYSDLLEAGIKDQDMKLSIIYNGNMHAIVVVAVGNKKYILDNRNPLQLVDMRDLRGVVLYEANQSDERWYADGKKILKERPVASPLRWKK